MRPLTNTTYLGVAVLDGITSADAPAGDTPSRRITLVDPGPGLAWQDAHEALPRYRRTLRLQLLEAADVADVYTFMDGRLGRLRPFWLPSWDADLTISSPYANGVQIVVENAGYTTGMFPAGASRRHVQVRSAAGVIYRRRIVAADWDGIGWETIDLSASIVEALPTGTAFSFLRYCRLDVDLARVEFAGAYAECDLPVIEIPQECPV